jgi:anti-sigma factor RsiW
MTCEDLLRQMNDYVDGSDRGCQELRRHLEGCEACRVVMDTLRNTITIYKNDEPVTLSSECEARLQGLLKRKWEEKFRRPQAS